MITTDFLASQSIFGGVTEEKLKKIIPLLKEEEFEKGDNIINEGEVGDRLYLIYEGSVEILKMKNTNNSAKKIATLKKGDNFGEMELIDIQKRTATVKAIEKTIVLSMSNKDLYSIQKWSMETFVLIIMNLAREISRRLRKMNALVADF